MKLRLLTAIALAAAVNAGSACGALTGQPAGAPDLNAIPDKMPFNIPFGTPINLEKPRPSLRRRSPRLTSGAGLRTSRSSGNHGDLVAFMRMDGAQLASIAIAEHKARTAARYRRPTLAFEDAVQKFGFNYHPDA